MGQKSAELIKRGPDCKCCGGRTWIHDGLNLANCDICDHLQQVNISDFNYNETYLDHYKGAPVSEMSFLRLGIISLYYQELFKRPFPSKNIKILDFGCGDGAFVKAANGCGLDAYGFDVIDKPQEIPMAKWPHGDEFNIITFFDSLEHVREFDLLYDANPDMFVASVPDRDCISFDRMSDWKHYKPNEHLHYFSKRSIRALFENNGYELRYISNIENLIRGNDIKTYIFTKE